MRLYHSDSGLLVTFMNITVNCKFCDCHSSSVADPDNFAPEPDPAWDLKSKISRIFVIFFSGLIQDFYSKIILYENRILSYYIAFLTKRSHFSGMIFRWFFCTAFWGCSVLFFFFKCVFCKTFLKTLINQSMMCTMQVPKCMVSCAC